MDYKMLFHLKDSVSRSCVEGGALRCLRSLRTRGKASQSSGRSMIEMLGVLSVIAVLSIGGLTGYSQAVKKYRFNELADEIVQITNNIRTQFPNDSRAKNNLTLKQAIDLGIIPAKMVNSDKTSATHPFGGSVTLSVVSNRYYIYFNDLPDDVLRQIALSGLDSKDNLTKLYFNGYTIKGLKDRYGL